MEALSDLQKLVDGAMAGLGFSPEKRPFRPHLTLGRVRERTSLEGRKQIGEVIQSARLANNETWYATDVHLIRSTLTPQGAIYDSIGQKAFGAKGVSLGHAHADPGSAPNSPL